MPPRFAKSGLVAALSLLASGAGAREASANSLSVQLACANDYYSYCSRHNPDSAATRSCMRANGPKLSQRCLNALIAAGEVSNAEVKRRASLRK